MSEVVPDVPVRVRTGISQGLRISLRIVRVTVPLYVAVDLLEDTAALEILGRSLAPVMGLFGLPGETAFAFVAGFSVNLYAAIAILAPLKLTPFQITQCGLMLGIAHNLLVEGGVLRSTGARGGLLTLYRVLLAAVAGLSLQGVRILGGGG